MPFSLPEGFNFHEEPWFFLNTPRPPEVLSHEIVLAGIPTIPADWRWFVSLAITEHEGRILGMSLSYDAMAQSPPMPWPGSLGMALIHAAHEFGKHLPALEAGAES